MVRRHAFLSSAGDPIFISHSRANARLLSRTPPSQRDDGPLTRGDVPLEPVVQLVILGGHLLVVVDDIDIVAEIG